MNMKLLNHNWTELGSCELTLRQLICIFLFKKHWTQGKFQLASEEDWNRRLASGPETIFSCFCPFKFIYTHLLNKLALLKIIWGIVVSGTRTEERNSNRVRPTLIDTNWVHSRLNKGVYWAHKFLTHWWPTPSPHTLRHTRGLHSVLIVPPNSLVLTVSFNLGTD